MKIEPKCFVHAQEGQLPRHQTKKNTNSSWGAAKTSQINHAGSKK